MVKERSCPHCGKTMLSSEKFCNFCGKPLPKLPGEANKKQESEEAGQVSKISPLAKKEESEKESWTTLLKRKTNHWKSDWHEKKEVFKEKWEEFERSLAESKEGKQVRSGKIENRKIPLIQCSNCLHHVGEQISRYLALGNEAICECCGVELVEEYQLKTEFYVYLYKAI